MPGPTDITQTLPPAPVLGSAGLQDQYNLMAKQQQDNFAFTQATTALATAGERDLTRINVERTFESGRNASLSKNAETLAKIGKMGADASNKLWG